MDLGALGLPTALASARPESTLVILPPCPNWLTPISGFEHSWRASSGSSGKSPSTPAQRAGKLYEKRVMALLSEAFPAQLTPGPWFGFLDAAGFRTCQPDGILECRDRVAVVEVKRSYSGDAWWQLRHLYEPVVQFSLAMGRKVVPLQVCQKFDPAVRLPEPVVVLPDLESVESWLVRPLPVEYGVFVCPL